MIIMFAFSSFHTFNEAVDWFDDVVVVVVVVAFFLPFFQYYRFVLIAMCVWEKQSTIKSFSMTSALIILATTVIAESFGDATKHNN